MKGEYLLLAAVIVGGVVVWTMRKKETMPSQSPPPPQPAAAAPLPPSGYQPYVPQRPGPAGWEDVAIAALNFGGQLANSFGATKGNG